MRTVGDSQTGTIRPEFNTSISIDFQGAKITSDTGTKEYTSSFVAALNHIGCTKVAELTQRAINILGIEGPITLRLSTV